MNKVVNLKLFLIIVISLSCAALSINKCFATAQYVHCLAYSKENNNPEASPPKVKSDTEDKKSVYNWYYVCIQDSSTGKYYYCNTTEDYDYERCLKGGVMVKSSNCALNDTSTKLLNFPWYLLNNSGSFCSKTSGP